MTFAERYVGDLLDQVVSVINAPTADKPYHKTYTIRLLGNVVEGRPVVHLNLTMDELKAAIIAQLKAGKVVWFGSDTLQRSIPEKLKTGASLAARTRKSLSSAGKPEAERATVSGTGVACVRDAYGKKE